MDSVFCNSQGRALKAWGFGGQRADRAKIDDIAREFRANALSQIGRDLHILAAAGRAQIGHAGNFGGKADAARAMDAAGHHGLDQRADIFVFDRPLVFVIASKAARP